MIPAGAIVRQTTKHLFYQNEKGTRESTGIVFSKYILLGVKGWHASTNTTGSQ
jgi:hypothetical protein